MVDVVIVDDSRFTRMMLRKILTSDSEIRILGEAADGASAIEMVNEKSPQVVTLDLQMPGIDGLAVLSQIMKEKPDTRVVVISAVTKDGAEASQEAVRRGAAGAIQKPSGTASAGIERLKVELIKAVKDAAAAKPAGDEKTAGKAAGESVKLKQDSADPAEKVVVMCASTGGPQEIRRIVMTLKENMPAAVIIDQQLHSKFTKILMKDLPAMLGKSTSLAVSVASDGDVLCRGQVVFTPEGFDLTVEKEGECLVVRTAPMTGQGGASFDVLLSSVARACGSGSIGILLTGETNDGVAGLGALKKAGGFAIVQDPTWGCASPQMARMAIKAGNADYVLQLEEIAKRISSMLERGGSRGQEAKTAEAA